MFVQFTFIFISNNCILFDIVLTLKECTYLYMFERSSIFQNHLLAYFTTQAPTYMEVVRPSLWASSRGFMKFSRLNAGIIPMMAQCCERSLLLIYFLHMCAARVFVVQITIMYIHNTNYIIKLSLFS